MLEGLVSLFTDHAITYPLYNGFYHMAVKVKVAVQMMVRYDLASSGVAFNLNPDTGFYEIVFMTGYYGLVENVVRGKFD